MKRKKQQEKNTFIKKFITFNFLYLIYIRYLSSHRYTDIFDDTIFLTTWKKDLTTFPEKVPFSSHILTYARQLPNCRWNSITVHLLHIFIGLIITSSLFFTCLWGIRKFCSKKGESFPKTGYKASCRPANSFM